MFRKTAFVLIIPIVFLFITGCRSLEQYGCPCGISRQEIVEDKVQVEFVNVSGSSIKNAVFVVNVGSEEDAEPYRVEYSVFGEMESGESDDFSIPLDYIVPSAEDTEGFYIDSVYAARIEFSDGRVWTDSFGRKSV